MPRRASPRRRFQRPAGSSPAGEAARVVASAGAGTDGVSVGALSPIPTAWRPLPQLPAHVLAHPHLARVRRRLDARGHVHAIAVQIPVLALGHIAHVDADPELPHAHPLGLGHAREVRAQGVRRAHRLLGRGKLGQRAVAEELDHTTSMGLDDCSHDGLEARDRAQRFALVRLRQRAVANQVREPDRCQVVGGGGPAHGRVRVAHRVPVPLCSAASSFRKSTA
jgi:hypothetical protein